MKTLFAALLVAAAAAACHFSAPDGASTRSLSFGGASRPYLVYAPKADPAAGHAWHR
ncbi:MAG: hypothetical protein ABI605_02940 [Rhizobacter sp.]